MPYYRTSTRWVLFTLCAISIGIALGLCALLIATADR
jgi:hypothetical protein